MLGPVLMGLVAGARSITPLAAVSGAAARGSLPSSNGAPSWLGSPPIAAGLKALAAGELLGDKLPSAPDRTVLAGMLARIVSGGLAGAALSPRKQALQGAAIGAAVAVVSAYVTFHLRMRAMNRFGQAETGVVEDAIAVGAAMAIADYAGRPRRSALDLRRLWR